MGLELHPGLQVSGEGFLYFWVIGRVQVGRWEHPDKAGSPTSKNLWAASRASRGRSPPQHHMLVDSVLPFSPLHLGQRRPPLPASSLLGGPRKEERRP